MVDGPLTGWHLDKRVSVGHIITTITVAGSIFLWLANIEKRVDLNEQAIRYNAGAIERNNADILDRLDQLIVSIQRLEDKLDRDR